MKRKRTLFQRILWVLMTLTLLEAVILVSVLGLGLISRPDRTETDALLGQVYILTDDIILTVLLAVAVTLFVGLLMSFLMSYVLQKPISQIARDLLLAEASRDLVITPTNIVEIDAMLEVAMRLNHQLMENGRMFSKIVEMSSLKMSGFRIALATDNLFLSENFFHIFGREDINQEGMTRQTFEKILYEYGRYLTQQDNLRGVYTLCITQEEKSRYLEIRYREAEGYGYGLIADVTQEVVERQLLQHERDHDSLTGLYNRRAFHAQLSHLLAQPLEDLKYGAMVMVDLDNLKFVNDSYGHEYGDRYIVQAAYALEQAVSGRGICARISGDEFTVFLWGFDSPTELNRCIRRMQELVNAGALVLPEGKEVPVHATGGVARFPEHGTSADILSKHADYAMYTAKRSKKRSFQVFDPNLFQSPEIRLRNSELLTRMLQYKLVYFAFQPIVDVRTGEIFAYEALMRPEVAPYFTVADVLETARKDGKLEQIEELTVFEAMESFLGFKASGEIAPDVWLFANSFPGQVIGPEKRAQFIKAYGPHIPRLVLELTEEDRIDAEAWRRKETVHRNLGGKFALDDYGSGWNTEKTLLTLSPEFIKVDMSIIRDIHLNKDKQAIVRNIVHYAHERGKFIIAEGIETPEEVRQLIAMDVDYVQGYFFGKPQRLPGQVSQQGKTALKEYAKTPTV